MLRAGSKECSSVSGELFTEQKRGFTPNKLFQLSPSLQQWPVAKILAVQMEKIEGAKDQGLRAPADR
jgi:hypothetical protein